MAGGEYYDGGHKYDYMIDELRRERAAREKAEAMVARLRRLFSAANFAKRLAIVHDRQPYPTAWAYEKACGARQKQQDRAEKAEAMLNEAEPVMLCWRAHEDYTYQECGSCPACLWLARYRAEYENTSNKET